MSNIIDSGFPEITDAFLASQDIFYGQFNDIEFYVEDKDQEHFYFNVLKKLFPDLKFEKIFPLNGKDNVKIDSRLHIGNNKKVYIVDLDFDEILGKIEEADNLFYLKKYSIENYLFIKESIYEIIRSKYPKLKNQEIDGLFDYDSLLEDASLCLKELAYSFVVIQKYNLGLSYHGLNTTRDFDFTNPIPCYRMNFISDYLVTVKDELKNKDSRLRLNSQIRKLSSSFATTFKALGNIPGKYILTFIKDRLQTLNLITQMSLESFSYKLSKEFNSNELEFLKIKVLNYIR